jgi:hypothetical protein
MATTRFRTGVLVAAAFAVLLVGGPASAHGAGGQPFRLALGGAEEAPVNLHGDADHGSVELTINQGLGRVCWTFGDLTLTEGEALPHIAHIHKAPRGEPGPIVVHLFGGGGGSGPAPAAYPTGTTCVHADEELLKDIRKNPEDYYCNLHNATHPSGVVRAQLD